MGLLSNLMSKIFSHPSATVAATGGASLRQPLPHRHRPQPVHNQLRLRQPRLHQPLPRPQPES
jgi:hypothetical protein